MKITLQYTILLFFTLIYSKINAQDVITKRNGEDVYSKVLEITQTEIKYKKFENENGPTYTILIKDVLKIHYENGTNDIFNEWIETSNGDLKKTDNDKGKYLLGVEDAKIHYDGFHGAGTGTFVTSIFLSPLVGLVPAISCSSTRPKDRNLNYPDAELIKNHEYYMGYTNEARRIKQRNVWKNWTITVSLNLVVILLVTNRK
jgi:hypothetical protein